MKAAELSVCTVPVWEARELCPPLLVARASEVGDLQLSIPLAVVTIDNGRAIVELKPDQVGALLNWLLSHCLIPAAGE